MNVSVLRRSLVQSWSRVSSGFVSIRLPNTLKTFDHACTFEGSTQTHIKGVYLLVNNHILLWSLVDNIRKMSYLTAKQKAPAGKRSASPARSVVSVASRNSLSGTSIYIYIFAVDLSRPY